MRQRSLFFIIAVLIGIFSGYSDIWLLQQSGLFLSKIFINIFKCLSIPVISLSIIVTMAGFYIQTHIQAIWKRTLLYTFTTTLIAAGISFILYGLIQPASVPLHVQASQTINPQEFDYFSHLANLIPTSLFSPFLEQQVFGVLLVSTVVGLAIGFIPDEDARQTVVKFFKGMHGLLMVITRWVIQVIPLGLYGFVTASVMQYREGMSLKGIGSYLLVVVLANLVQGLVILPLWLKSHGIKPFVCMRKMLPALSLAFFSKSSIGTLPVTLENVEKSLNVKPEISRFVLPLCTSLNMNGCAAFIFATVVYLMQNHGITLSLPMMGVWVVVATLSAIGNAGVPMGCFFLSVSLLASMNVPLSLMGIILPFYTLIDMLETALNVWSDTCVVKVVNDRVMEGKIVMPLSQSKIKT